MGFGKDGKGAIIKENTAISIGALAGQGIVGVNSSVLLDMDFRILRADVTCVLRGLTAGEGNGLILYLSQGILATADQELNIEQNGPIRLGERIEEEVADRWVRRVGITDNAATAGTGLTERSFINRYNGGLLEIEPRWTFRRGRTATEGGWNWAVYNSGATLTVGATAQVLATHYGVWVA